MTCPACTPTPTANRIRRALRLAAITTAGALVGAGIGVGAGWVFCDFVDGRRGT